MLNSKENTLKRYLELAVQVDLRRPPALPPAIQREENIVPYFYGWVSICYAGPFSSDGFIDFENFLNPRLPVHEHVIELANSIELENRAYEYPMDMIASRSDLSPELLQAIQGVDGSLRHNIPPLLELRGRTKEEMRLRSECWHKVDKDGQVLTPDQLHEMHKKIKELVRTPGRPKARFLGGRQRHLAMERLARPVIETQHKICDLGLSPNRTSEEQAQLELLLADQQKKVASTWFRVRLYDGES